LRGVYPASVAARNDTGKDFFIALPV